MFKTLVCDYSCENQEYDADEYQIPSNIRFLSGLSAREFWDILTNLCIY